MARPVSDGAVLEVRVFGICNGQRLMNVWHYWLIDPTPTTIDGDAAVNALLAVLNPGGGGDLLRLYRAYSNENVTWLRLHLQWVAPIRYSYISVNNGAGAGEVVEGPLPVNVCGVAQLRSIDPGPGGSGRKHFGGLSVTDVSGSLMTNDFITGVEPIIERMGQIIDLAALSADATLNPAIWNKEDHTKTNIWTSYQLMSTSRVMRRRTVGVGE